ncbi:MAG: hypothetical protein HYS27_09885 [Deltaproteobacteria bacterium]|nr:hypothetical protein [Deltaproteobacteria bacterium]
MIGRLTSALLPAALSLALAGVACVEPPPGPAEGEGEGEGETPPGPPISVVITPSGVLLTPSMPSQELRARLLDAAGTELEAAVQWASAKPDVVAVDEQGTVSALVEAGSALITATVTSADGTMLTGEVLAVAAVPAAGAVVINDDDVIDGFEPELPDEAPHVGSRYAITLTGVSPPAVGTLLLGTGDKLVSGRVVAVDGARVTLELVPLDELFASLDIDATLDLSRAPFEVPVEVQQAFTWERLPDGSLRFTPREAPISNAYAAEFPLGPFACEADLSAVEINLLTSNLTITTGLSYEITWNDQLKKMLLVGEPRATLEVTPVAGVALAGSVTCKLELAKLYIGVPGVIGFVVGATVPLGAGFELAGEIPFADVGLEATSEVGVNARVGFICDPDCEAVTELDGVATGKAKPVYPASLPSTDLTVEAQLSAFVFADIEGGARFWRRWRVRAIECKAGIELDAVLAPDQSQAADVDFKGDYQLSLFASAEAGRDFAAFLGSMHVNVFSLALELKHPLASSPVATSVTADREAFEPADEVTFEVKLDPGSTVFPVIGYNVTVVRLYRRVGGNLQLANEVQASPGQTDFNLRWTASETGTIPGNFVAFVETVLTPSYRFELADATSTSVRLGSYTATRRDENESSVVTATSTATSRTVRTQQVSYSLRLVSSTAYAKEFLVTGGTASYDETYDYVERNTDLGSGECTYHETLETHETTQGSGSVTGGTFLFGHDPEDNGYGVEPSVGTTVDGTRRGAFTARYEFLGTLDTCATNVDDPLEEAVVLAIDDIAGEGTAAGDLTNLSDTVTMQGPGWSVTTSWTFTVDPE